MPLINNKSVRDINYLAKDFDGIKSDLIDYIKRKFPNDFQDFNEASGGMAILEMIAYIGDVMTFYIDRQVNETFLSRSIEEKNILANAKSLGYKTSLATPAITELSITSVINYASSANETFTIKKGSRVITDFDPVVSFELIEDVDFSSDKNRASELTETGELILTKSSVSAIAGITETFNYEAQNAEPFLKISLPDEDITEITSITSSDGNQWYEVDYLAQDTLFVGEENKSANNSDVPNALKLKKVQRRYTVERETEGRTSIRFGSGIFSEEDSEIIPNPEDYVLTPTVRGSASGFIPDSIDSSSFLKTKSLGVAPRNVTLSIKYRYGGGLDTNVGINTLNTFRDLDVVFTNPDALNLSDENRVLGNISVTNTVHASGGKERETSDEIKEFANANFFAQNRAVTLKDYQARIMSMPNAFGTVFRSFARKDKNNNLGVEIILMGQDSSKYLTSPSVILKNNIETYINKFKSFSDSIKLVNGNILNIGIDFTIVPDFNYNDSEALLSALFLLRNDFDIKNTNFNDQIVISDISRRLQSLDEIRSVSNIKLFVRSNTIEGRSYSPYSIDLKNITKSGIVNFPEDVIWEVKYLNDDILGRVNRST